MNNFISMLPPPKSGLDAHSKGISTQVGGAEQRFFSQDMLGKTESLLESRPLQMGQDKAVNPLHAANFSDYFEENTEHTSGIPLNEGQASPPEHALPSQADPSLLAAIPPKTNLVQETPEAPTEPSEINLLLRDDPTPQVQADEKTSLERAITSDDLTARPNREFGSPTHPSELRIPVGIAAKIEPSLVTSTYYPKPSVEQEPHENLSRPETIQAPTPPTASLLAVEEKPTSPPPSTSVPIAANLGAAMPPEVTPFVSKTEMSPRIREAEGVKIGTQVHPAVQNTAQPNQAEKASVLATSPIAPAASELAVTNMGETFLLKKGSEGAGSQGNSPIQTQPVNSSPPRDGGASASNNAALQTPNFGSTANTIKHSDPLSPQLNKQEATQPASFLSPQTKPITAPLQTPLSQGAIDLDLAPLSMEPILAKDRAATSATLPKPVPFIDTKSAPQTVTSSPDTAPNMAAISLDSLPNDLSFNPDPASLETTRVTQAQLHYQTLSNAPQLQADLVRSVAQQMAAASSGESNKAIEIALSPEELGRVKITFSPSETGMVVSVLTERPETLDLMRRNINSLAQEFLGMGYDQISFNFNQSGSEQQQNEREKTTQSMQESLDSFPGATKIPTPITIDLKQSDRIDIRI